MGEVYEAEDLELRERVALKTVRPEIAQDERAIERFKREIHLARKVTHPNVCRIFDLGHHQTPLGGGGITFLTMELLAGETLSEQLRRTGRLSTADAFPLVAQMASALAAAHSAGIVHRDLKPGNVVLVPSKEGEGGVRAVVTDFGLARRLAPSETVAAPLSSAGEIVGTPAYMAPEQVEGGEITLAADIYALGIVMYEMVTGTPPFVGATPISTAFKRLKEPPASPRTHVPGLDPTWEAVILRCLARDPADRFVSATDVVRGLGGEQVALGRQALEETRKRRRWLALAGVLGLLLLASGVGYHLYVDWRPRKARPSPEAGLPAIPIKPRRSVAVLGFKNLSGLPKTAWLSTALPEMLATELAAGEKLRTIPGENVAQMKVNLSLVDADSFSKETLARIRANLGADLVVLGSYIALGAGGGGQIRLDLRLQDAVAGETIASVAATGTEAKLFDLVSKAGAALRERLGVGEMAAADAGSVQASRPSNLEAARLYSQGLAKLRVFDTPAARDLLEQAVAVDPQNPLPHAALAGAWSTLGYDGKAKEEAKKAFDLSGKLPREERFLIEGGYREAIQEWSKAVEIYRKLFALFPDDLDHGLRLARAQAYAGMGKEALVTVQVIRALPPPARDDPRIDMAEALAAGSLSDFARQQEIAARAAQKGKTRGARLLVAEALASQGLAFWRLGQPRRARSAFEEARRIYSAVGDWGGVVDTLNNLANLLADQGDIASAQTMYEAALGVYREIGDQRGMAQALNNIALLLWQQGALARARAMFDRALPIYRETGDKENMATVLDNTANVLLLQGDPTAARKMYEEALAVRREIGNMAGVAVSLNNVGSVLHQQGDLGGAAMMYEDALSVAGEIGDRSGVAYALFNLGEVLKAGGNLSESRKKHEQALAIRKELGEKGTEAESQLALGELAIEDGRPADAVAPIRQAGEEFRSEHAADSEALVHALLARCLLEQGNVAEAQKAVEQAWASAAKSENRSVRFLVGIILARVRTATGKPAEAIRRLEAIIAEATKAGLLPSQIEARLALGEIEVRSLNPARGRARLAALEREAAAKGFGLIARKAAAARK
jgi:tetratricopeptide (TPR) repeat protein/tRNA A-37 threonylcarbamoyl transferase component Bud32